jgi:hypothetical protein
MKSHPNAGGVNLRGKKSRLLGCGCCAAYDLRDKCRAREAKAEMRDHEG